MEIGDIVIVREDTDWFSEFKKNRKFIVTSTEPWKKEFSYVLEPYEWPKHILREVFNTCKTILITESETDDLILLDKEFIKNKIIRKLELQ
jgi:hypothetical protein